MARGGACVVGDMCSRGVHGRGACVAGGGVHGRGACMAGGGMHGWEGACVIVSRYYEIGSMSGRYTSYWNAFLS